MLRHFVLIVSSIFLVSLCLPLSSAVAAPAPATTSCSTGVASFRADYRCEGASQKYMSGTYSCVGTSTTRNLINNGCVDIVEMYRQAYIGCTSGCLATTPSPKPTPVETPNKNWCNFRCNFSRFSQRSACHQVCGGR